MKNILVIGAGRSSTALIKYLLNEAARRGWFVTVADNDPELAEKKVSGHANGRGTWLDVMKPNDRREIIERNDIVVSLLPANLHLRVAKDCIKYKKHLITASYVSRQLYELSNEVKKAELIFMGEMGLDPGIDHMSTMKSIDDLREIGATITSYTSYTGGLIAPESDTNPWNYKITWNPRNVVLAGQGTAQYLQNGKFKYIPYHRLFKSYKVIDVPGHGEFEAYANRSSLLYRDVYGLQDIPNIMRATLRKRGFCDAWNALVSIGLTDNTYPVSGSDQLTYYDFLDAYITAPQSGTLKERISKLLEMEPDSDVIKKLEWLGLFERRKINLDNASPAQILQELIERKWKLKKSDKDMIVMHHEFGYTLPGVKRKRTSTMVLIGENSVDTGMSKLVGLPLGIFAKLVLLGKIKNTGVNIPVIKDVYTPVLEELAGLGVKFEERDEAV
ncbi:MAG: saccharopine dehydrogenase C-terminal domain-containing protein [Bacteroidota bacterium]